jgi:peptidyl-Lys metalloendopeptidase
MFAITFSIILFSTLCHCRSSFISVDISANKAEPYLIDVNFHNTLEKSVFILKWNSPFDVISGATSFVVERDGQVLPYLGALAKRFKSIDSYLELRPYEDTIVTIDLSRSYDFFQRGSYSIQMKMEFLEVMLDISTLTADPLSINVRSNQILFQYQPAIVNVSPLKQPNTTTELGITYQDCTTSEQTVVKKSWDYFITMINSAVSYMSNNQQTATFTTFFGPTSGWSIVLNVMSKEKSSGGTGAVRFNCDPPDCGSDSVFAYVYPTDTTKTVYLCGAYWKAKLTGYDSQQGVIVHELSHFNAIGGTKDYAYGVAAAKQLAISSPAKAIANADNYEYYCETVPHLYN